MEGPVKKFVQRWSLGESSMSAIGTASVIGLHMVSGIIVGGAIGYLLDDWLGTGPWLKIVFFLLGVAAGFRNVYQDTARLLAEQDKKHDGPDAKN